MDSKDQALWRELRDRVWEYERRAEIAASVEGNIRDFLEWMEDTGGRIDEVDKLGERFARIARQIEQPDENPIIRDAALALGQFRRRRMKDQPNPPGEWEGVLDDIRRALAMAISPEIAKRRQRADEQAAKACEELAAFERRLWPEAS